MSAFDRQAYLLKYRTVKNPTKMTPRQLYLRNMHAEFCIFTCNTMLVTSSELPVFAFHFVSDSVCYGSRTELQQRWFFWGNFCLSDRGGQSTDSICLVFFLNYFTCTLVWILLGSKAAWEWSATSFVSKFSFQSIRSFACTLSFLKSLEVEGERR